MPGVRHNLGRDNNFTIFNVIKFYPLAFLVAHKLASYENLPSLHQHNQLSFTDRTRVEIDLLATRDPFFPESVSDDNYLLTGKAAKDSVFSIPKPPSKKSKNSKKVKKPKF